VSRSAHSYAPPPTPGDPSRIIVLPDGAVRGERDIMPRSETMRQTDIRRIFSATVLSSGLTVVGCARVTNPQRGAGGGMMGSGYGNGWMGGYAGPWMLVLLVLVAGLVAWFVARGRTRN